jgi:hypothetical protein
MIPLEVKDIFVNNSKSNSDKGSFKVLLILLTISINSIADFVSQT